MSDEIKVVISIKNGKNSVGVQAPSCDPIFQILDGGLETALARVPTLVEEARKKWAANPRNPRADLPAPAAQTTQVSQGQREARAPKQPASPQPKMF